MANADTSTCHRCGKPRGATSPSGLCPGCLLGNALREETDVTYSFVAATPSLVLDTLAASIGPVPRVLLPDSHGDDGGTSLVQPSSPEVPAPADRPSRVQVLGEIARGGMGAILKGRDPDLGRDLAVKVLLDAHRKRPELVRRFVEEAQIAGQLQHPGVVPVYELGCFADARPYFTMKLVKGRTLAQLLADRASPGVERSRFVGIFEQVAQTTAYAHARGVIHRDLKPSNVMVGSFGEVLVMDWGLAKVLPKGGATDDATAGKLADRETVIATARSGGDSDVDLSSAGSVMGTPSYMAPEQARGEVSVVDERADVFALGSILCEILTGSPAFVGRTSGEIQRCAARGDLTDALARLSGCGVDGELVDLARNCLAAEPDDRPRNAGVVTERLANYLAGVQERLHAAELAHAAEVARAEEAVRTAEAAEARSRAERRARRLTAALAASAVLMTVAGAGGWAWTRQQRAARGLATAREVDAALREATISWGRAKAAPVGDLQAWGQAVAAAKRAESILSLGVADAEAAGRTRATVAALTADRDAAVARAEATARDRRLLERIGQIHARVGDTLDRREAERDYATAFREAGIDADKLPPAEAGAQIAVRPGARELTAALAQWIFERQNLIPPDHEGALRLLAVANAADPDQLRIRLREAIVRGDADTLRQLADSVDPLSLPVETVQRLAEALKRVARDSDRASRLLRPVQRRHPGNFWINWDLATTLSAKGPLGAEEAVSFFTAAVAIRPESVFARTTLGRHLGGLGRREEATAQFQEALRIAPDSPSLRFEFASVLAEWGQGDRAFAEFAEVVRRSPHTVDLPAELLEKLRRAGQGDKIIRELRAVTRRTPDDATAHFALGHALDSQGPLDEAIAEYRESMRLRPEAYVSYLLGMALERTSAFEDAIAAQREAVKLDGDHLGDAIFVLANLFRRLGHYDEATEALRSAAELARREGRLDKVKEAEGGIRMTEARKHLADRLPGILAGTDRPKDANDLEQLSFLFHDRRLFAAGARCCESAFRADPKLAENPQSTALHNAACLAIRAGFDEGRDVPPPDAAERARLRGLALTWLRTHLDAWRAPLKSATPESRATLLRRLDECRNDVDFAYARGPEALAKMTGPEQERWKALWADLDQLVAKARDPAR
jgi:tetratricopeptide (TPR) repeat protein/tRNA A-37 threonylcarbamoyl transferase component Bud32